MQRKLLSILTVSILLFAGNFCWAKDAEKLYFGLPPFANPTTLQQNFAPLAEYLSTKLDRPVQLISSPNYISHIMNLGQGRIDIAYVGPSPYVKAHDKFGGIELLAKLKMERSINDQIVIITREDSDVKGISDLAGKTFAFGDYHSFGSHFMPRYVLHKQGLPLKKLTAYDYVGSHDNVVLSIQHGDFAAGGLRFDIFQKYQDRPLRIIHGPVAIPPHVLVCRSSLPEEVKETLRLALFSITDRQIYQKINPAMLGFEPVADQDFNLAREVIDFIESK